MKIADFRLQIVLGRGFIELGVNPVPAQIPNSTATIVSAGDLHVIVTGAGGISRTWGNNQQGQLGIGQVDFNQHNSVDVDWW